MTIRRFREGDAEVVSALIARTLRESNSRDYPAERIEQDVQGLNPEEIRRRAGWTHFYVAEENGQIVGCGAIGPYWGSETESSLFTILCCRNTRAGGLAGPSSAPWRRTRFSCGPGGWKFPPASPGHRFT